MPFTQVIPASFPSWARDTGPGMIQTRLTGRGMNMPSPYAPAYDVDQGFAHAPAAVYSTQVPVSSQPTLQIHRGAPCWRLLPLLVANGSGFWFGDNLMVDISTDEWASGVSVVPEKRVFIDEFMIAFDTPATLNTSAKLPAYTPVNSSTAPILAPGLVGNQYGLAPDGAGGFVFNSIRAGALIESVAITWPEADLSQWVRVRVEHFNASSPLIPARVRFTLNDTPVITRSWGAGSVLPDYDEIGANGMKFRRQINSWANTSTAMFVAQFRSRSGEFDATGIQIT